MNSHLWTLMYMTLCYTYKPKPMHELWNVRIVKAWRQLHKLVWLFSIFFYLVQFGETIRHEVVEEVKSHALNSTRWKVRTWNFLSIRLVTFSECSASTLRACRRIARKCMLLFTGTIFELEGATPSIRSATIWRAADTNQLVKSCPLTPLHINTASSAVVPLFLFLLKCRTQSVKASRPRSP